MTRTPFVSIGDFLRRGLIYVHRRHLRAAMPRTRPRMFAGYPVAMDRRVFDRFLPDMDDIPDYEEKLIAALTATVRPGDRVVVVGGGWGTTAVVAAKLAGPDGRVVCYEASTGQLPILRETFRRNAVAIDLRHAIVGKAVDVYGGPDARVPILAPHDLPDCDVLEMDCEGAESTILARMTIRPRAIAVETHGVHGAPTHEIHHALEALGYAVTDLGLAEPRLADTCRRFDVNVLLGRRCD